MIEGNGATRTTPIELDKQFLDVLNSSEGFGLVPGHQSPTKTLRDQTASMNLVNENLSPTRLAIHKQIGGRIIQENEIKLAHTLEENTQLKS